MKTFEEIINFEPQVVSIENGAEPSIVGLLQRYYNDPLVVVDSESLIKAWLKQLKEFLES